jgi:hypothetical protein
MELTTIFKVKKNKIRNSLFIVGLVLAILSFVRSYMDYNPFYPPAYRAGILYYYLFSLIIYLIFAIFIRLNNSENGLKLGLIFLFLFTVIINFFISIDDFARLY